VQHHNFQLALANDSLRAQMHEALVKHDEAQAKAVAAGAYPASYLLHQYKSTNAILTQELLLLRQISQLRTRRRQAREAGKLLSPLR
jgi:hypothetical protein